MNSKAEITVNTAVSTKAGRSRRILTAVLAAAMLMTSLPAYIVYTSF